MPHRAAQQVRPAAAGDYRLVSGNEVFDQTVVKQIVRRFRERDYADLAIDVVGYCRHGYPRFSASRDKWPSRLGQLTLPRRCRPVDVWPLVARHIGRWKEGDNVKLCQL
jgi:hypothetical protein